jgi:hypothetical protein
MTDLILGPDASHHQGHVTTWPAILADPRVGFAWCKASQSDNFTDPEAASNLKAFQAAAERGDIDWFGAYLWPGFRPVPAQVARFKAVVAPFADDPRFQWRIDCEGGGVAELDGIAEELAAEYDPERGGVYGGSYLMGPVGNPTPAKAPHAAAAVKAGCSMRAAYISDEPGHGRNVIPALYAGQVTFWQYTNGISGPIDRDRFPRTLDGGWHGDVSCFWEPTAGCTYAEWLAKTIPGHQGGDDMALDPVKDAKTFKQMLDAVLGTPSERYWEMAAIGFFDAVLPGREHRDGMPAPYEDAYKAGASFVAGGKALDPALATFVETFSVKS